MHNVRTLELAQLNGTEPSFLLLITCAFYRMASQSACYEKGLLDFIRTLTIS